MKYTLAVLLLALLTVLPVAAQDLGSVQGIVVTAQGDPIPRVPVILTGERGHGGGNMGMRTLTDENGEFEFAEVRPGEYTVAAVGPRMLMVEEEIEVNAGEVTEVELVLDIDNGEDGAGGVTGVIVDPEGVPIEHADVMLMPHMGRGDRNPGNRGGFGPMLTRTDEEGRFVFEEVPAGETTIAAGKRGYEPYQDEIEVVDGEVLELEIVLQPFDMDFETGTVAGNVSDVEGNPIELAHVMLIPENMDDEDPRGGMGGRNGWFPRMVVFTDEEGNYEMEAPVGDYIARAAKRGYIHADEEVSVEVDDVAEVNFVLEEGDEGDPGGPGGHRGGENRHRRELVELHGFAIVIEGDVADIYMLDTDNDDEADYLLNFGPPDYEPENGAQRPANGEEIDIDGMQVGHMEPPMVIVLSINGEEWRDLDERGHGGRQGGGGGWGEPGGELELVEAEGFAIDRGEDNRWFNRYWLDTNEDEEADYRLCFGAEDYDPGNGAERPENGEFVNIVGGLFEPRQGIPTIIVYQIDGQLWREPGDTLHLFWEGDPDAVEYSDVEAPASIELVRIYPNPFNPTATIEINLSEGSKVAMAVFDLGGREVIRLNDEFLAAGSHTFQLNGQQLRTGTYFLKVDSNQDAVTRKLTLVK